MNESRTIDLKFSSNKSSDNTENTTNALARDRNMTHKSPMNNGEVNPDIESIASNVLLSERVGKNVDGF